MNENQISEQARRTAEEAKETAQEWGQEATGAARRVADKATETARHWTGNAKDSAREVGAAADLYLHEYAWTSLTVVAFVAGIVGYLIGSSRRA